jgi:hypothetical protein
MVAAVEDWGPVAAAAAAAGVLQAFIYIFSVWLHRVLDVALEKQLSSAQGLTLSDSGGAGDSGGATYLALPYLGSFKSNYIYVYFHIIAICMMIFSIIMYIM